MDLEDITKKRDNKLLNPRWVGGGERSGMAKKKSRY